MSREAGKYRVMLIEEKRVVLDAPDGAAPLTIDLPGRWSDLDPETIGNLIRDRAGGASANAGRVLIGAPASWVLSKALHVPSNEPAVIAAAVRLRISRDYATDSDELVGDYTVKRGETGSDVLIGVTTRARLDRLGKVLELIGLTPAAIHLTTQAYVDPAQPEATYLRIKHSTAEAVHVEQGRTTDLRTVCNSLGTTDTQTAARTITGSLATDPRLSGSDRLVLVADPGSEPIVEAVNAIMTESGRGDAILTINESPADVLRRRALAADMLDLHRCRASQAPTVAWSPTRRIAVAAVVAAALLVIGVGGLWWSREHRLASLNAQQVAMSPQAEALGQVKKQLDDTAAWFDKRIDMIACMNQLTGCVPKTGELRLTELRLNADHSGSLQGRAGSRDTMLRFLDTMQASEQLTNVALRDSAESSNGRREVRFEIVFTMPAGGRAR